MSKKYRLLWDLPFATAGEIFTRETDLRNGIDYIEIYKKAKRFNTKEEAIKFLKEQ